MLSGNIFWMALDGKGITLVIFCQVWTVLVFDECKANGIMILPVVGLWPALIDLSGF